MDLILALLIVLLLLALIGWGGVVGGNLVWILAIVVIAGFVIWLLRRHP